MLQTGCLLSPVQVCYPFWHSLETLRVRDSSSSLRCSLALSSQHPNSGLLFWVSVRKLMSYYAHQHLTKLCKTLFPTISGPWNSDCVRTFVALESEKYSWNITTSSCRSAKFVSSCKTGSEDVEAVDLNGMIDQSDSKAPETKPSRDSWLTETTGRNILTGQLTPPPGSMGEKSEALPEKKVHH